ncbi:MAG: TadE family type IV pilus minor pilin [Propionibacteriaceae bacterium]
MVTAELAVATLTALAVLTMLSWGIFLIVMQMRCIDTAGEVARQAARGDKAGVARAKREAPRGAVVTVKTGAQVTSVDVRLTARPFTTWLVSVPLSADAEVVSEPGVGGAR